MIALDHPADGVTRLTFANPSKRNALSRELLDSLATALRSISAPSPATPRGPSPDLPAAPARCVVLTGAGNVFSAGYDIADLADERVAAELLTHPFEAALEALDAVPVPVIAAMDGHAFGGGLELALACDLRVCAPGARMGMPPARLGVVYSPSGLQRFVDAIGAARTRELFLTARALDADEALAWGLVNELAADADGRAVALAAEIAALSPLSVRGNKRVLRALVPPLDPELAAELHALREAAFASEDFAEGVRAFVEKRPPEWHGR